MPDIRDLSTLIKSRIPIVIIEARDETRVVECIELSAAELNLAFFKWCITEGLQRMESGYAPQRHNTQPAEVLAHIKNSAYPGAYLLIDFHPYLESPTNIRLLKEIAQSAERNKQTLILFSYRLELPAELDHFTARYKLSPPGKEHLKNIIREEAQKWRDENQRRVKIEKEALNALLRNLAGLSTSEARRLAHRAIFNDGAITGSDLPEIIQKKYELLNKNGVLSFEPDSKKFTEIGGLENLKGWLKIRKNVFLKKHAIPGLPTPKGIMLVGVQGGGKSLAAKAVAGTWNVPLLRLDFGALYNKYFGETERNIRESLQTAQTMAPCVLWLDEIEKGVATNTDDNGTSRRVLGTLLTWMAENKASVFLVATANDIQSLPPELVRKGRLDEIFFVDLPDFESRKTIFSIHLKKRRQDPGKIDLEALADASEGFSGAEIEQAVVAALYSVLGGTGKIDTRILLDELVKTRPLSVVMAEKIADLRAWAAHRTVPAN